MEVKKKNFLENLRLKTKFGNLKKPRKKALDKQDRRLAHRRSLSVPDLRLVPGEAFSIESALESTTSEGIFFGISPGVSDSDSVASGSNTDGPFFTEKLSDSVPETGLKVPTYHTDAALNRVSTPVGSLLLEEIDELINSGLACKLNSTQGGLYARVDKKVKGNVPTFTFDPVPVPRSVFTNAPSSRSDLPDRGSPFREDSPVDKMHSDTLSAALIRAHSFGDQVNQTQKRTTSCEPKKASSEKGTPPIIKRAPAETTPQTSDSLGTPLESADGTSLDSACGTPIEERVNMPWMTDSEDLDRDLCSGLFMRDFSVEEGLLEGAQSEETQEEIPEVSFISVVFSHMNSQEILLYVLCRRCYWQFLFRC